MTQNTYKVYTLILGMSMFLSRIMFVRMQVSIPGIYIGFNPGSTYHVSFINICLAEREPTFKTFSIATFCSHKHENLNTDLFYIHYVWHFFLFQLVFVFTFLFVVCMLLQT